MSRFREAGARRDTNYFIKHSGIVEVNSSIWEQVASTDQKKTNWDLLISHSTLSS